jgi:polysaccharide pyruvyl transferase WcaK-like protein
LFEADLVAAITGGDSFSDIYGFRRFFLGFLRKWLVIFLGKKLILLPQTYGPFRRPLTKIMAKFVMNRASVVYSRDRADLDYVKNLLTFGATNGNVRFAPDVGFVLDPCKPKNFDTTLMAKLRKKNVVVVGLNVSGLLFNGGCARDNMFGLKSDYRKLIYEIIKILLRKERVIVLLIPHVFPPPGYEVESDPDACRQVYDSGAVRQYKNQIFLASGEYNHNEIKYIIGLCDFFIGSRMHACIAAMSQFIPAVAIAYSKKFRGIFEGVGLGDCVADARSLGTEAVLQKINTMFEKRQEIKRHLQDNIPQVKANILYLFKEIQNKW